jgi:hypothetical protein
MVLGPAVSSRIISALFQRRESALARRWPLGHSLMQIPGTYGSSSVIFDLMELERLGNVG